jgi:hypothetical protein
MLRTCAAGLAHSPFTERMKHAVMLDLSQIPRPPLDSTGDLLLPPCSGCMPDAAPVLKRAKIGLAAALHTQLIDMVAFGSPAGRLALRSPPTLKPSPLKDVPAALQSLAAAMQGRVQVAGKQHEAMLQNVSVFPF